MPVAPLDEHVPTKQRLFLVSVPRYVSWRIAGACDLREIQRALPAFGITFGTVHSFLSREQASAKASQLHIPPFTLEENGRDASGQRTRRARNARIYHESTPHLWKANEFAPIKARGETREIVNRGLLTAAAALT